MTGFGRCGAVGLALAALSLGTRAGGDEPAKALLAQIANPDDPGREKALEAWEALTPEERVAKTREGLRSDDPQLAFAAAVVASPWNLDLGEIRRQARILAREPLAFWTTPEPLDDVADSRLLGFGADDLPAIWRGLSEADLEATFDWASTHRALRTDQVPGLVPLLETAKPTAFRGLLADLVNQAQGVFQDAQHEAFVRAFRFGLARLRAEKAKTPVPALRDLPSLAAKPGLPAEFVELARGAWGAPGQGFDLGGWPDAVKSAAKGPPGPLRPEGPYFWLARWAQRLVPAEDDLPFLEETIRAPRAPTQARIWAARRIAAMDGRAAGHALSRVLGDADTPAQYAAAEAASRGRRDAWEKFLKPDPTQPRRATTDAGPRWLADPAAAEAQAAAALGRGERPEELEAEERQFLAHDLGVTIPGPALTRLADRVRKDDVPPTTALWFFADVLPEAMTAEDAARLANRLAEAAPAGALDDEVVHGLALLEAFAPEALLATLRAWADAAKDAPAREHALRLLVRLGDTTRLDAILASWPSAPPEERALFGRVRDPRVEALLREKAGSKDLEEETCAVHALALFLGCPEPLGGFLAAATRDESEPGAHHWAEAKALVLAGDPIGAVLARTAQGPDFGGDLRYTMGLGLTRDPRVVARLTAWRDDRSSGLYWPATACLALQGDPGARAEWRGFLEDGRTFLLDDLQEGRSFTLDGDPEWVSSWVARLEENCCLGWHADTVLRATFPTRPYPHNPGDSGRAVEGVRRWFAANHGTFVRSRLLGGWVPGPRR